MNMETKKGKIVLWISVGVAVAVALFVFALPPFMNKYLAKHVRYQQVRSQPLLIEVEGKISVEKDKVVALTNQYGNSFILVGEKAEELAKMKDKTLKVFGKAMVASAKAINNTPVKFNIDVVKYGVDLSMGTKLSKDQIEALKAKAEKKQQMRREVLAKLKKEDIFEVIKGKLIKETREEKGSQATYLIIQTDDNDRYVLVGQGAALLNDNLAKYEGKTLVILGKDMLPIGEIPMHRDDVSFWASQLFDENLNQIN